MADVRINGVDYDDVPRIDVPKSNDTGNAKFYAEDAMQQKSVVPTNVVQTVTPDVGKGGLDEVTVGVDKAVQAATATNATTTPVLLDFSENTGLNAFYGWTRFFRSNQEDRNASLSSFGSTKYCIIKLPKDTTVLSHRLFAGMTGLKEIVADLDNYVTAQTRVLWANPNVETAGNLWNKLQYVTNNSFRPSTSSSASKFEQNKDIVASALLDFLPDSGYYEYAFASCGFHSFTAPLLQTIRGYAFMNCMNMVYADFSAVTAIYQGAFQNCTSLADLYLRTNSLVTLASVDAFDGSLADTDPTSFTLHVPASLVDDYKNDTNWGMLYNGGDGINIVGIS